MDGENLPFEDGSHIIYVNGEFRDTSHPIGRLMHDFHCANAADMYDPILADRVRYFKEDEGSLEQMSRVGDKIRAEALAEGRAKQHREDCLFFAQKLIDDNTFSNEKTAVPGGFSYPSL